MAFVSVRHRVSNYEVWRAYFDGDSERQRRAGIVRRRVFKATDDGSDVLVVFELESREKFRPLLEDPDLKALMAKAGVVSEPQVTYWEDCGGMDLRGLRKQSRPAAPARRPAKVVRVARPRLARRKAESRPPARRVKVRARPAAAKRRGRRG